MEYCVAQTSMAHTYGNVACFIVEYLKNLFPRNYFKTVHVSSTIAYRQFNRFQNTDQEFLRKGKPMLIIRPRVEINDNDVFLFNTYLTTRITDTYMDIDGSNLQYFFHDAKKQTSLKFLLNRMSMLFDITIITETQMEQLNQANFIKNRIHLDRPMILSTSLESYLPRELMEVISKDAGIPLYDTENHNSVSKFINYMNANSIFPISYKMKNSTGNDEFFRFYPANIDTIFSGLSVDDGSKKGFVSDSFTTSFTISTEFNAAGLYYYFTSNHRLIEEYDVNIRDDKSGKVIPLFTVSNLHTIDLPEGWLLYASPMYQVAHPKEPDITDISSLFNQSLKKIIEYHKLHGLSYSLFINEVIMKDNTKLTPNVDYIIDYEEMILTTLRVNMDSTYRIILHVNANYVNNFIMDIFDLEEEK